MSNQIVITSGAKVRNLSGVLTATSGVVDSVGFGTANGVATLDSNGKVPLSQLPASVVTYLGTWNAATNTPTLANGTGDVGDLYICNVAGTVNFGAGPITFAVGDWVIYNGSQWQKSAGSTGTVTSVAMTVPTGLSVTGSPITTSGTLAVSLSSGYTIPTTSFLSGLVPYTGATTDVDLGAHVLNAQSLHVKGTAGAGHLGLKHQSTAATGSANESLIYANVDGDLAWQNDNLYLTTLSTHANTANRVYTFPNASGTIALTSDISYPVTSVFGRTGAVTAQSGDYTTTLVTEGTNLYYTDARARGAISLTTTGTSGAATYNSTTGVLNIPNYSETTFGTVTSVGLSSATSGVTIGSSPITTSGTITLAIATASGSQQGLLSSTDWNTFNGKQTALNGYGFVKASGTTISYDNTNYLPITGGVLYGNLFSSYDYITSGCISLSETGTLTSWANSTNFTGTTNGLKFKFGGGLTGELLYDVWGLIFKNNFGVTTSFKQVNGSNLTYTLPASNGTLALTSDIPSLSGYVPYTGATADVNLGTTYSLNGYKIGLYNGSSYTNIYGNADGISINFGTYVNRFYFNNSNRTYTFPDATGTLVLGTGTTNYLPKFTGTSTIGNSMLTDDGTTLQSIGATRSNLYLKAASTSYYSQLAFTNGSSAAFGGLSYNNAGQYMQFETNSSEWMRLTNDGKLGIGTTTPLRTLSVVGSADSSTVLYIQNTSSIGYSGAHIYNNSNVLTAHFGYANPSLGTGLADSVYFGSITNKPIIFTTTDTERMRITSSGNVGIATSSPFAKFSVGSPSGIGSFPTYSTSDQASIGWNYWTSAAEGYTRYMDIVAMGAPDGTYGGSVIRFLTNNITNASNPVERMRISSIGNVTTPNQTYFYARAALGGQNFAAGAGTVLYGNVDYNVGNAYNSSTSTFTAPVSGVYVFSCQMFNKPITPSWVYWNINGTGVISLETQNTSSSYVNFYSTITRYLAAGDTIKLVVTSSGSYETHVNGSIGPGSFFSGYLLG